MSSNVIIIILFLALFFFSCSKTTKKDKIITSDIHLSKRNCAFNPKCYSIYGVCIILNKIDKSYFNNICDFTLAINPKSLIEMSTFSKHIKDKIVVSKLNHTIYDNREIIDTLYGFDNRLILLAEGSNKISCDTISYYHFESNKMLFNNKYLYKYDFNIIDSVMTILNLDTITCSSP